MSTYAYGESLWIKTAPQTQKFNPLTADSHADVVVIGGGLTGLHTALALTEVGKKVILVEQHEIASGSSSGALAKVAASHAYLYSGIYPIHGEEGVRVYGQANIAGYHRVQELMQTYDIECDFEHSSNFIEGTKPKRIPRLEKDFAALSMAGLDVTWTKGAGDKTSVFPGVTASIKNPGQGHYHPRKFAFGLLRAFTGLGGKVFENTEVTSVTEDVKTNTCIIKTASGKTLTSDYAVVATRIPDLLSKRLHASYALWDETIHAFKVDTVKYRDTYFRLSRTITSYRPQVDKATGTSYVLLEGKAPKTFSRRLGFEGNPAASWYCQDTETKDYLPTVGRWCNTRKHLYCALGYNGWGMTNSAAAGLLLAQEIAGDTRFAEALNDEKLVRSAVKLLTPLNKKRGFSD